AEADAVSINLKLVEATRGFIGADLLRRMKPDAYLVNTSRGPIVDERALLEVLQGHKIAGAALDVYDEEPMPPDHRLRRCDNVLLLGHCGYGTDTFYEGMIPRTLAVVEAFLEGKPVNLINPEARKVPS